MQKAEPKHKCKNYEVCGYGSEKRGAVNLHQAYHCPVLKIRVDHGGEEMAKKEEKTIVNPKPCCDEQEIELMNKQDTRFKGALTAGYKKICVNCMEVYK